MNVEEFKRDGNVARGWAYGAGQFVAAVIAWIGLAILLLLFVILLGYLVTWAVDVWGAV